MCDGKGASDNNGMRIVVQNELGQNQPYNIMFASAATGITYAGYGGARRRRSRPAPSRSCSRSTPA